MKKKRLILIAIALIILIVIVFVLISSFGGKKVICTNDSFKHQKNYQLVTKYIIKSKGDNVVSINISETITSEDKSVLSKYEKQLKEQYSYNKKNYGGYSYKVTNKDGKVVGDVNIDYKKFDMDKFINNNEAMKEYTENNRLTLDGAKKMYEATGAVCK